MLITQDVINSAQTWWNRGVDLKEWAEAPISMTEYKDTEFCPGYKNA